MNLGLEVLYANSSTREEDDILALYEECHMVDLVVGQEDKEDVIEKLTGICNAVEAMPKEDQRVALEFLSNDINLATIIGPNRNLDNLKAFIKTEAGVEGQKLQDFLRWGVGGLVIGLYLGSFNRILKVLNGATFKLSKRSQYLPPYNEAKAIIAGANKLISELKKKDNSDGIVRAFSDLDIQAGGTNHTDWKAVGGSALGGWVGHILLGVLGAVVGNIAGKLAFSKRARQTAIEKGYTDSNINEISNGCISLINTLKANSDLSVEIQNNPGAKKLIKKAAKAACQLASVLGRGLAATTI